MVEECALSRDDQDKDFDQDFDLDDDQDDRSITIGNVRISRDMLVLFGALAFLIFAVILTFLVPLGGDDEMTVANQTATAEAQALVTNGEEITPTLTFTQSATLTANPQPDAVAGVLTPTPTEGGAGYLGPDEQATSEALGTPRAEESPYPIGTASPSPTGTANGFPVAQNGNTPAAGGQQQTAYPDPDQDDDDDQDDDPTATRAPAPPPTSPPPPQPQPTSPPAQQPQQPPVMQPTAPPAQVEPTSEPVTSPDPQDPGATVGVPGTPVTVVPPPPTFIPVDVLSGDIRWTPAQSPIILTRDVQLSPGSTLIIDAGVEVRLGPGVSFFVDGATMFALGAPGQPVRFVGEATGRWEGLFGRPDGVIVLKNAEIQGGGAGGTLITSERGGELVINGTRIFDNGGAIIVTDSKLEVIDSEISGNDMPYGAALDAVYTRGERITIKGSRIGGNRLSDGAPNVRISGVSSLDTLILDIQNNLFRGGTIGNLLLSTNGPLEGTLACNTMVEGNLGLSIRSQTLQVPEFPLIVANNAIDTHTPPIIPIYLEFGIGRGAASEVVLDMRNNWWGDPTGPYDPEYNPLGRGDSVGDNITYEPWLTAPPECVPPAF